MFYPPEKSRYEKMQYRRCGQSGGIAFTPLAQGLLTNRYWEGIPAADSRASKPHGFLKGKDMDGRRLGQVRALREVAHKRGQSLAQMALGCYGSPAMTSALIGASRSSRSKRTWQLWGSSISRLRTCR